MCIIPGVHNNCLAILLDGQALGTAVVSSGRAHRRPKPADYTDIGVA